PAFLPLDPRLAGLDFVEHRLDAELVDPAQARRRDAQPDPAVLAFDPEAAVVEVGLERAQRLVVGVRNVVALHRLLAGDLTDAGHCSTPGNLEKPRIIPGKPASETRPEARS